jgi:hypothetical protein
VLLIARHTGTYFDYICQCSAAKGIVCADRSCQLLEQFESGNCPFTIESLVKALAAVSKPFYQVVQIGTDVSRARFDTCNVLPGFTMCVLDWYARALRSKDWRNFVPEDPAVEWGDKCYWVNCHAAMRSLSMDLFTNDLQAFVERLSDYKLLLDGAESYTRLLRVLQPSDPLIAHVARRTARQIVPQTLWITDAECSMIIDTFPKFARMINDAMTKSAIL